MRKSYLQAVPKKKIKPHTTASSAAGLMSALALGATYLDEGDMFLAVGTALIVGAAVYAFVLGVQYVRLVIVRRKATKW